MQAVAWYRKAAELGSAHAQYQLAQCYAEGIGVEKLMPAAVEWYRKAASNGSALAMNNLV